MSDFIGEFPKACPECGGSVSQRGGEILCNDCGLVLSESIFDNSRYPTGARQGGSYLPGRLGNAQRHVNKTSDRNMAFALAYIKRLVQALSLPTDAAIDAIRLYKKAFSIGMIRGRNIEIVAAALVYAVSRKMSLPRTVKEIAALAELRERDVFRMYKRLSRSLNLSCPLCKPEDYLLRFANALGHSEAVNRRAMDILSKLECGNRSPTTLAAAALYVAGLENGEHRSFKKMSKILGVGEAAIREAAIAIAKNI